MLFPEGSLGLVEAVYKDNPVAARFSRTLAEAAAALVRRRWPNSPRPGCGSWRSAPAPRGTSEAVFQALAPVRHAVAEYCYTDVSRAFLIHAERCYAERVPGLRTALLDVEKTACGPGRAGRGL